MNCRICIIVPTYQNGATLRGVVELLLPYRIPLIIVNDGSTDGTEEILAELSARESIVESITHPRNMGKGRALCSGFRRALEEGFDYAITIDADGQHNAADIPLFLKAIEQERGAIVVGNRFHSKNFNPERGGNMNAKSKFANRFSNFWFLIQTGIAIPDTQTGYRAYPLAKLRGLSIITARYESELELLVYAAWGGVRIKSIDVDVYYPPKEERVSHFRPAADFARISLLNTLLTTVAIIYAWPKRALNAILQVTIFIVLFLLMIVGQFCIAIYFTLFKGTPERKLHYHKLIQSISRWLITHIPGVKFSFANPSGETFETPSVIICNHQSHLDLLCVMMVSPKIVIVTKQWVWRNPFYGIAIRYADFINSNGNYTQMESRIDAALQSGYSILIFPEGTRSASMEVLRFHKGAFQIACTKHLPIIPLVIRGAGEVLNKRSLFIKRGAITLEAKPRYMGAADGTGGNAREMAKSMRSRYREWV